ncbi:MAG: Alpha-galactosidase, partial [Thermotogales bacterium 46_20]
MRLFFSGRREPTPVTEGEVSVERAGLRIIFNTRLKNGATIISADLHNISDETMKLGSMDLLNITEVYPPVYMNSWQSWLPFKAHTSQPDP